MQKYTLVFTKTAKKDVERLSAKQKNKLKHVLEEYIVLSPYQCKKFLGPLSGNYSYRLDIKNRIIYSIDEENKRIIIKRSKTHYGD